MKLFLLPWCVLVGFFPRGLAKDTMTEGNIINHCVAWRYAEISNVQPDLPFTTSDYHMTIAERVTLEPGKTMLIELSPGKFSNIHSDSVYLKIPLINEGYLYLPPYTEPQAVGSFQSPSKDLVPESGFLKISSKHLKEGALIYLTVRKQTHSTVWNRDSCILLDKADYDLMKAERKLTALAFHIPTFLFLGLSIPMLVFSLLLWWYNNQRDYLWYALYLLCLSLLFGRRFLPGYGAWIGDHSLEGFFLGNALDLLSSMCYMLFAIWFLKTKERYPVFHKVQWGALTFLIALLIADSLSLILGYFSVHQVLIHIRALVLTVYVLGAIAYLYTRKNDIYAHILATGTLFFSAGSIGLFLSGDQRWLVMGVLVEMLVFSSGLAIKARATYREKGRAERKATENQIQALRAQMNPHFIFNALGSVQYLIMKEDKKMAVTYLNKFSKLLRNTLENSIKSKITLSEEIQFLRNYLELEALRFDGNFTYSLNVDPALDPEEVVVPLLLIQPFVENAILHGLQPKTDGERKLSVLFSCHKNKLHCIVEDNGVGRNASPQGETHTLKRPSRAMEVTQKRLDLLAFDWAHSGTLLVTDLKTSNGKASGTRVTITVPVTTSFL